MHHAPAFVERSDQGSSTLGLDATAAPVLEVTVLWNDLVLDTVHRLPKGDPVVLGAEPFVVPDDVLPTAHRHLLTRWVRDEWVACLDGAWSVEIELDGQPVAVPSPLDGEIRVSGVNRQWVLRIGDEVVCIEATPPAGVGS